MEPLFEAQDWEDLDDSFLYFRFLPVKLLKKNHQR